MCGLWLGTARLVNKFAIKLQNAAIDPPFCAEATRVESLASVVSRFYINPYYGCAPAMRAKFSPFYGSCF